MTAPGVAHECTPLIESPARDDVALAPLRNESNAQEFGLLCRD
jgi:hypothetical protein